MHWQYDEPGMPTALSVTLGKGSIAHVGTLWIYLYAVAIYIICMLQHCAGAQMSRHRTYELTMMQAAHEMPTTWPIPASPAGNCNVWAFKNIYNGLSRWQLHGAPSCIGAVYSSAQASSLMRHTVQGPTTEPGASGFSFWNRCRRRC